MDLTVEQKEALKNSIETTILFSLNEQLSALGIPGICIGLDYYGITQQICSGVADISTNTVMTSDMNFRIADATQTFTAAAIFKLIESGAFTLNSTITEFTSFSSLEIPNKDQITIYHLLHMTSGLEDYQNLVLDFLTPLTPSQIIATIIPKGSLFTPGEKFNLCNTNYVILGMIIEEKSGKTYAQYIQDMISQFQLTSTTEPTSTSVDSPTAKGYIAVLNNNNFEFTEAPPVIQPSLLFGTQSMISIVSEMTSWINNLMQGKVLTTTQMDLLEFSYRTEYGAFSAGLESHDSPQFDYPIIGKTSNIFGHTSFCAFDASNYISFTIYYNSENQYYQQQILYSLVKITLNTVYYHLEIPFTDSANDNNDTNYNNTDYNYNDTYDNYYSEPFSEREIIEFIIVISLIFLALAFIRV